MKETSPDSPVCPICYDGTPETRAFWNGHLPHWDVYGRPIFLTLHVRGAIPLQAAQKIRASAVKVSRRESDSEYARKVKRIFAAMDTWLDHSESASWLTMPSVADMLCESIELRKRQGKWRPLHWVIMPNHLHVLYIGGSIGMQELMHDFKRWTAMRANVLLDRQGKRFWQEDWFDHWSRSADETDRIAHYIRNNPVRAGLVKSADDWRWSSWCQNGE